MLSFPLLGRVSPPHPQPSTHSQTPHLQESGSKSHLEGWPGDFHAEVLRLDKVEGNFQTTDRGK